MHAAGAVRAFMCARAPVRRAFTHACLHVGVRVRARIGPCNACGAHALTHRLSYHSPCPRHPRARLIMENTGQLEPRVSVLDDEFNEQATLEVRPLARRSACCRRPTASQHAPVVALLPIPAPLSLRCRVPWPPLSAQLPTRACRRLSVCVAQSAQKGSTATIAAVPNNRHSNPRTPFKTPPLPRRWRRKRERQRRRLRRCAR